MGKHRVYAVSYTHLDVYKRQHHYFRERWLIGKKGRKHEGEILYCS